MRIYFVNESGKKLRFQHCSQFFSRGIQGHTSRTSDSHCAPRGPLCARRVLSRPRWHAWQRERDSRLDVVRDQTPWSSFYSSSVIPLCSRHNLSPGDLLVPSRVPPLVCRRPQYGHEWTCVWESARRRLWCPRQYRSMLANTHHYGHFSIEHQQLHQHQPHNGKSPSFSALE